MLCCECTEYGIWHALIFNFSFLFSRKDTGRSLSNPAPVGHTQTSLICRKLTRTRSVHLVRWPHERAESARWFEARGAQADLVSALPWFNLAEARATERIQCASARDAMSVNFYPTIHCDKLDISLTCACALCQGKCDCFPRIGSFEQFVHKTNGGIFRESVLLNSLFTERTVEFIQCEFFWKIRFKRSYY